MKMGKSFIRWAQILFLLNLISFFLSGSFLNLGFAVGIALILYIDSETPVEPEEGKEE